MKKRIKIDSSLLSFLVILTGISFMFRDLYQQSELIDNVLDFLGVIIILKGTLARMIARGYKKAHSNQGKELVIDGPYILTRNPMYLGSFMLGCGFVLIVWPWWCLPIFALLFYLRFNKQMKTEEEHLTTLFGKDYEAYCRKVSRLFPKIKTLLKTKTKNVINLDEAMDTKEVRGLIIWPAFAFALEILQQFFIYGELQLIQTYVIFVSAAMAFAVGFVLVYQWKS